MGFATVADVDDNDGELEDLFVDPQWHRRGIAQWLIRDAVGALGQSGRHRLWVVGNPQALAFYRAVGFLGDDPAVTELGTGLCLHLDV